MVNKEMNKVKICFLGLVLTAMSLLYACGGEDIIADAFSAAEQFEVDKELIRDYLSLYQFEEDTTDLGVRLVVEEEGTGALPEVSDLVYFDYAGRFINRNDDDEVIDTTYFDTTIFTIANEKQGVEVNDPARYRPIVYSYSSDGWTLTSSSGGANFIIGFRNGVTEIMKQLRVGGKGQIIMPSNLAYGVLGTTGIGPNQVLVFEIYLRQVDK